MEFSTKLLFFAYFYNLLNPLENLSWSEVEITSFRSVFM